MAKKRTTYYFIQTEHTHTQNKLILALTQRGESLNPSSPFDEMPIGPGKTRPMIPVSEYFFMNFVRKSASDSGYMYVPYYRRTGDEYAKEWILDKRKTKSRNKEVRRMRKKVEILKKESKELKKELTERKIPI